MKERPNTISFPRVKNAWEYGLTAGAVAIIGVLTVCFSLQEEAVWLLAVIFLFAFSVLLVTALLCVHISPQGVAMTLCGIPLKKVDASALCTIVKTHTTNGRWPLDALALFSVPAEEMEADGERRLRKDPIRKGELKFREGRSDWGDMCMGMGFYWDPTFPIPIRRPESPLGRWKSGIWLEYSPEREELLRKTFPQAQFRTPKRYSDPPSRN